MKKNLKKNSIAKDQLQELSFNILFIWDQGPWVKVPKALEENTLMWVYEVAHVLGF